VSVAGPPGAFEEITGGTVVARERLLRAEAGRTRYVTHMDIVGKQQPAALGVGTIKSPKTGIEGVLLERPRVPHGVFPRPIPPGVAVWHLRVPDDVSLALGASEAHQNGHVGRDVTVAMVDTGQYAHPFFGSHGHGVRTPITLVPGTSADKDPVGHGTGESANIFAVAPGATLQPYRASDDGGHLVAALAGFLRAKADHPAVLTNSWGGDSEYPPAGPPDPQDTAFALEIQHAIEEGILVVFSAGNGQFSIEPQVPGVLAAGGAYLTPELELQASDYASGYQSPWFEGVVVPTVCGLVGMRPRAQYLLLPVQPGCELDVLESQPEDSSPGDGTRSDDGWALFSGTSAAAPQLAGVAALVLGAKAGLKPSQAIEAIQNTAVDVTAGRCHPRFNNAAQVGPDLATGAGLANAWAAVQYALAKL
jgi:subtilisin family serine protease